MTTAKKPLKETQKEINAIVEKALNEYNEANETIRITKRFRSCSAYVLTTNNYFVLQSYNTIVAFINRNTGVLYDFSRYVYGYTATTSQHIAKFARDFYAVTKYTWR